MSKIKKTFSAGGVVLNSRDEVLVVSQKGDSWSLPKGHLEEGENERVAAEREIREESGLSQFDFVKDLGSYERPRIGRGGFGEDPTETKKITMFLFRATNGSLGSRHAEHPEARWVKKENVAALLTHPKDKAFFLSVLNQL